MKKTKWFPGDVRPVRVGWYEWERSSNHRFWTGEYWTDTTGWKMPWTYRWRGLASDPKGK